MRHFRHFTMTDRLRLETYLKAGKKPKEIAVILHFHISNIYREISRGLYSHKNTDWTFSIHYGADIAERKYRTNLAAKGSGLKIGNDHDFAAYIENKIINEKYSPAAVLMDIKNQNFKFSVNICVTTLYSYIDKGVFLNLSNKDLPVKSKRRRKYRKIKPARAPVGDSIEQRPHIIGDRKTFGNWEMDTVKGKNNTKNVLLVLTERLTRQEFKIRMSDNTAKSVVKALDNMERKFGQLFPKIFNSITIDNGSEFSDFHGIESSCLGEFKRTKTFYCHPYCSWERGSNENQNKLIRRWIPKGTPIENYTDDQLNQFEDWINDYPRLIFGGKTSNELFQAELAKLV